MRLAYKWHTAMSKAKLLQMIALTVAMWVLMFYLNASAASESEYSGIVCKEGKAADHAMKTFIFEGYSAFKHVVLISLTYEDCGHYAGLLTEERQYLPATNGALTIALIGGRTEAGNPVYYFRYSGLEDSDGHNPRGI